jgi:hypothetical protein
MTAPQPVPVSTDETIDLAGTIKELAKAFAPDPELAKKAWFEIERDAIKAGSILKQLLCDDDGPDKVKAAILEALSDGEPKK